MIKIEKNLKEIIFCGGIAVGLILSLILQFSFSKVEAGDVSTAYGAIVDSTDIQSIFVINSGVSGSIINDGTATVYFNWSAGTVEASTAAGDSKCYLLSGESIHIPSKIKKFTHATSTGIAKLRYIAD
jgi:hypothetical protein